MKKLLITLIPLVVLSSAALAEDPTNKVCPIMTKTDVEDADNKVSYQGKDFYVCCSPCAKQFAKDGDYLAAVIKDMKSIPALNDVAVPASVKLLDQRFCPFTTDRLISPSCPTVEYKGVTVYLSKPGHVRTWNENPDKYAKEGFDKGLLPQLKGKL